MTIWWKGILLAISLRGSSVVMRYAVHAKATGTSYRPRSRGSLLLYIEHSTACTSILAGRISSGKHPGPKTSKKYMKCQVSVNFLSVPYTTMTLLVNIRTPTTRTAIIRVCKRGQTSYVYNSYTLYKIWNSALLPKVSSSSKWASKSRSRERRCNDRQQRRLKTLKWHEAGGSFYTRLSSDGGKSHLC